MIDSHKGSEPTYFYRFCSDTGNSYQPSSTVHNTEPGHGTTVAGYGWQFSAETEPTCGPHRGGIWGILHDSPMLKRGENSIFVLGKQTENKHVYLVGGLEHEFYFPFHIWDVILPIDELIFFRGVGIPPTSVHNEKALSVLGANKCRDGTTFPGLSRSGMGQFCIHILFFPPYVAEKLVDRPLNAGGFPVL